MIETGRPRTAKAAQNSLSGKGDSDASDKTFEMRRALAKKLKEDIVDQY